MSASSEISGHPISKIGEMVWTAQMYQPSSCLLIINPTKTFNFIFRRLHFSADRFGLFVPKPSEVGDAIPSPNEGIWYDSSREHERLANILSGPAVQSIQVSFCKFIFS